jgi:hypothetical protein
MLNLIRRVFSSAPIQRKIRPIQPSRTYRESIYSGRRIDLASNRLSLSAALSRVLDIMNTEGVMKKVRDGREWKKPGLVASLKRMKRRQERFNGLVKKSIDEINDVHRRIK